MDRASIESPLVGDRVVSRCSIDADRLGDLSMYLSIYLIPILILFQYYLSILF
jgi:hypothetical protein